MDEKEELERKKLVAELKKIEVETLLLQKHWYEKPNLLISIFGLLFGAFQFMSAHQKVESVSQQKVDNEIISQYIDVTLKQQQPVNPLSKPIIIDNKNAVVTSNTIDVWAYNVSDSMVEKVKSKLREQGNVVGFGGVLSSRPSWLSLDSTVLYYNKSSRKIADQLAVQLNKQTGIEFKVKRGAGLGVVEGEESKTFFIHIVQQ